MKKIRIITGLSIVAVIAGIMVINACTKQEAIEQTVAQKQEVKMSDEDIAVYNKIMDFKKKVDYIKENPGYKSGETMTVEEAQWNLDASFNFTYSFVFESFSELYTDSVFVEVSLAGDLINLDDTSVAYFEMYDKVHDVYEIAPGDNKDLYVSNTEIKNISSETVTFKTTATIGERGAPPEEQPFVEGDDWKYGDELGYCFPPPFSDEDAAIKIAEFTNTYRYLYIQDEGTGWHAYYTNPDPPATVPVFAWNPLFKNDNPLDNYRDYKMMCQNITYGPLEECIYWEEMNYYYFGTHEVIYTIIPDHPGSWPEVQGQTFYSVTMEGHAVYTGPDKSELYHKANVTYKTRHIIGDDIYPLSM
ncbi:MAG: hypothetical protein K8S16_18440 [Bacteroidales bacterium]|nr:hypothetical protein [Bacteroidales bacterium]